MKASWKKVKNYKDIKFDVFNGVAKITINRPKVYNAFLDRKRILKCLMHLKSAEKIMKLILLLLQERVIKLSAAVRSKRKRNWRIYW